MDSTITQCASQSVGPVNQLFGLLIKTILAAQCSISPPNLWPEDYGAQFIENSTFFSQLQFQAVAVKKVARCF